LEVVRVFDWRAAIVAADMGGQHLLAVQHPHPFGIGDNGQQATDMGVRNGISVAIETHIGGLAGFDRPPFLGRKGVLRQRQEAGLLLNKGFPDAERRVLRAPPLGRRT
jgi:hypothetical protein